MAVSFQIDGSTMPLDPEVVRWSDPDWVGRKHNGGPIINTKRSVRLSWEVMTLADYGTLEAACTSAVHTLKVPHPTSGTYTTFSGAYLRVSGSDRKDINVYGVELIADYVTVT
jgi:hypothetical protein